MRIAQFYRSIVTVSWIIAAIPANLAVAQDNSLPPSKNIFDELALRTGSIGPVVGETGLRGALETAVAGDPTLRSALYEIKAADREVWRELLKFTPIVTASMQANNYFPLDSMGAKNPVDRESYISISATLPLWTSGGRYYGIKAARSRRDAVSFEAMAARDQATMKFVETWVQAIAAMRDRTHALEALSRLNDLKNAVTARRSAGFASTFEVSRVEADIASARQVLSSIDGVIEKLGSKLLRQSGQKPDKTAKFPRFKTQMSAGKSAFLASAHKNNPQLRAATSLYYAELYSTRSSMSRFLPSVDLTGDYRRYLDKTSTSSANDRWSVGVRLQVPLLDLSSMADSAAQSAHKDAALYREAAALETVETEIEDLWSDYQATIAMRKEAESEIKARKQGAIAAQNRFEKGFGSFEEAISSQTSLLASQRTALQLAAQETLIAARLLMVSGRFNKNALMEQ